MVQVNGTTVDPTQSMVHTVDATQSMVHNGTQSVVPQSMVHTGYTVDGTIVEQVDGSRWYTVEGTHSRW